MTRSQGRPAIAAGLIALLALLIITLHAPSRAGAAMGDTPELRLELTMAGRALSVRLRNTGNRPQTVLYDSRLQPVELIVTDAAGRPVTAEDRRALEKFDPEPWREYYAELPAGGARELLAAQWQHRQGRFELQWGPWRFSGVAPGTYRVQARWHSSRRDWTDRDTGERGEYPDLWLGTLETDPVTLRLE